MWSLKSPRVCPKTFSSSSTGDLPIADYGLRIADWLIPYPVALTSKSAAAALGGTLGVPAKYLVDQERRSVGRYQGGNVEAFYRGIIDPLLRASSLVSLHLARDDSQAILNWSG